MKNWILLLLFFALNVTVSGQVLPDSIRIKYNAAQSSSEKGKILYTYLISIRDNPAFFTTLGDINKYFKANKDETGQAYLQLVNSDQISRTGDYATALKSLLQQLAWFENKKDAYGVLLATRFLGSTYNFAKDFENTIRYDKKNVELALAFGDTSEIVSAINNLGSDYAENNMPDSGLRYAQTAVMYGRKMTNPAGLRQALTTLAENYIGIKQYGKALPLIREVLNYGNKADINTIIWAQNDLAQIYLETNYQDSARYYAYKAAPLANEKGFRDQLLRAYHYLYLSYEKSGLKDSAFSYYKMSVNTKDSLYSLQNSKQVQFINFREQTRQQEAEQEKIQFQNKIRMYVLLAGLVIFFIIVFILFRNNRQKQRANQVLEKTLTDLKSAQTQLIQSEKMASLGELTAGIAHEIQNPLNFVNNFSEVSKELLDEMKTELNNGNTEDAKEIADDVIQNLEKINHHGKRADAIVKGMLQHSQSSTGKKEPTDINALCDEYLRLSYHGLRAKDKSFNATLKTDFDPSIGKINIIPQDIGRVILNLLTNAFYVVDEKKKACQAEPVEAGNVYEPTVSISTKKAGDKVLISVSDNGNGIPPKVLDKIFQPFFTTKPTGQGTGLGLSLSYDIIKAHGGEIKVETKVADPGSVGKGEGTTFIIQLPIV
ncbi:MAG: ATP-binding protein [Ferruginibacter sp.]